MVLRAGDLPITYSTFALDPARSGAGTRENAISSSCDPNTGAVFDASHELGGYGNDFRPSEGTQTASDGVFEISSGIHVFQDQTGAAMAFNYMADGISQLANTSCKGVSYGAVQKLDFPQIGDESWGAEVNATLPSGNQIVPVILTIAFSRKAQLIFRLNILRIGDSGLPDEAVHLLSSMVQRTH